MLVELKADIQRREADQPHVITGEAVGELERLQRGGEAVRGEVSLHVDDGRRRDQPKRVGLLQMLQLEPGGRSNIGRQAARLPADDGRAPAGRKLLIVHVPNQ